MQQYNMCVWVLFSCDDYGGVFVMLSDIDIRNQTHWTHVFELYDNTLYST